MSGIEDFTSGSFAPLLVERPTAKAAGKPIVFLTGKVFYDVAAALKESKIDSVCIARIEELYPFPQDQVKTLIAEMKPSSCVWVQEEPKNQGAWGYVEPILRDVTGLIPSYVGRPAAASTATGSGKHHAKEQKEILSDLLEKVSI
jgi:2-oxoglutarate dehydrogenase E1 component